VEQLYASFFKTKSVHAVIRMRKIRKLLANKKLTLDAGCGSGVLLKEVSRMGCLGVGLDVNKTYLSTVSARKDSDCLGVVRGDVCFMPFKNAIFEQVLCSEVLEHIPNDVGVLAEISRILKSGGILILTVPEIRWSRLMSPRDPRECVWDRHVRPGYRVQSLERMLEENQLRPRLVDMLVGPFGVLGIYFHEYIITPGFRVRSWARSQLLWSLEMLFLPILMGLLELDIAFPSRCKGYTIALKCVKT